MWKEFEVALIKESADNHIMDKLKQLGLQMEQQMKDSLIYDEKSGFWYDKEDEESIYTEEGIRLAVYEDMKDTLDNLYSECAY